MEVEVFAERHTNRAAPRVDVRVPVVLWAEDPEASFLAHSVNISETGMLVLSEEAKPRGSEVRFEFTSELNGWCEVIWTREAGSDGTLLGMKFQDLRRGARKALARLVELHMEP